MKRFTLAALAAAVASASIYAQQPAPASSLLSPGAAAARFPRNVEEFDQMWERTTSSARPT
jgi:hypothetical protein